MINRFRSLTKHSKTDYNLRNPDNFVTINYKSLVDVFHLAVACFQKAQRQITYF